MDCLEGVHEMQEVWILEKMQPDRAANFMVHLGPEAAARKLLLMDDLEARKKILAFMPPKLAAAVILKMDEMASDVAAAKVELMVRCEEANV